MSTVHTLTASPTAVIDWARANGHKELLSVLLPYEDQETLDDIWYRNGCVTDATAEVDYTTAETSVAVNNDQGHLRAFVEPTPPQEFLKRSEHHWLEVLDTDGHSFGLHVVQWNPGARRWSHSGAYGTGLYLDTRCWRYIAHCPTPKEEL